MNRELVEKYYKRMVARAKGEGNLIPLTMESWVKRASISSYETVGEMASCATSCCLAGDITLNECPDLPLGSDGLPEATYYEIARKTLEIGHDEAFKLFNGGHGEWYGTSLQRVTPGMVSRALWHFLQYGYLPFKLSSCDYCPDLPRKTQVAHGVATGVYAALARVFGVATAKTELKND